MAKILFGVGHAEAIGQVRTELEQSIQDPERPAVAFGRARWN
jgi:hypothetical protein